MGRFFLHAVSIRRRRGASLVETLLCPGIFGLMVSMLTPAIPTSGTPLPSNAP